MQFRIVFLSLTLLVLTSGCGNDGYKLAKVSGLVTLDGKPVAGLRVAFEPIATEKNSAPGPEAIGITDPDGKFYLKTMAERPQTGAVVGNCRVRIWSLPSNQEDAIFNDRNEGHDPVAEIKAIRKQIMDSKKKVARVSSAIPLRYNDQTTLSFTVPPEGSDQAKFDILSK